MRWSRVGSDEGVARLGSEVEKGGMVPGSGRASDGARWAAMKGWQGWGARLRKEAWCRAVVDEGRVMRWSRWAAMKGWRGWGARSRKEAWCRAVVDEGRASKCGRLGPCMGCVRVVRLCGTRGRQDSRTTRLEDDKTRRPEPGAGKMDPRAWDRQTDPRAWARQTKP
eukprot:7391723-Prymnesium_polylepis.4